ncbi:MAG: glucokinase [Gammaproteobacteria bacterium]|nr:glucokinase [Gammaproteobacteria bacterium]
MRVLAVDLGGTKTLLELSEFDGTHSTLIADQRYASADHASFDGIISNFLAHHPGPVGAACIAVAGPVTASSHGESAEITNLPWHLDSQQLASQFKIQHVKLINDFAAVAYGLDGLCGDELVTLQNVSCDARGVRLVLGAGTGLGVALMVHDGQRYNVLATEGGHAGFAPASNDELVVFNYLRQTLGHVSIEHVLSGPGLVNIYYALHQLDHGSEESLLLNITHSADPGAAISSAATHGDNIAHRTLDVFTQIYGNVAGNLALTCLPTGGIFLAGGIAPKIIQQLQSDLFLPAFHHKGKMSALMQRFPIKVVMNSNIGLIGARLMAQRLLAR